MSVGGEVKVLILFIASLLIRFIMARVLSDRVEMAQISTTSCRPPLPSAAIFAKLFLKPLAGLS